MLSWQQWVGSPSPLVQARPESKQEMLCSWQDHAQASAARTCWTNRRAVRNPDTGKRPPVWTWQLARAGYLGEWNGRGDAPCGTGVWTCPECEFVSPNYGGFGVLEGEIFAYEELSPVGVSEKGSLRLSRIADPVNTWLVGDAHINAANPRKGWYAIWPQPAQWKDHGPAVARHGGKANVCMADGHAERLTLREIDERRLTRDVTDRFGGRGR